MPMFVLSHHKTCKWSPACRYWRRSSIKLLWHSCLTDPSIKSIYCDFSQSNVNLLDKLSWGRVVESTNLAYARTSRQQMCKRQAQPHTKIPCALGQEMMQGQCIFRKVFTLQVFLSGVSLRGAFRPVQSVAPRRQAVRTFAASDSLTTGQNAALIGGAIFNPVVLFSEWTLFSTGKGLDPGPAGIYGALEGVGQLITSLFADTDVV